MPDSSNDETQTVALKSAAARRRLPGTTFRTLSRCLSTIEEHEVVPPQQLRKQLLAHLRLIIECSTARRSRVEPIRRKLASSARNSHRQHAHDSSGDAHSRAQKGTEETHVAKGTEDTDHDFLANYAHTHCTVASVLALADAVASAVRQEKEHMRNCLNLSEALLTTGTFPNLANPPEPTGSRRTRRSNLRRRRRGFRVPRTEESSNTFAQSLECLVELDTAPLPPDLAIDVLSTIKDDNVKCCMLNFSVAAHEIDYFEQHKGRAIEAAFRLATTSSRHAEHSTSVRHSVANNRTRRRALSDGRFRRRRLLRFLHGIRRLTTPESHEDRLTVTSYLRQTTAQSAAVRQALRRSISLDKRVEQINSRMNTYRPNNSVTETNYWTPSGTDRVGNKLAADLVRNECLAVDLVHNEREKENRPSKSVPSNSTHRPRCRSPSDALGLERPGEHGDDVNGSEGSKLATDSVRNECLAVDLVHNEREKENRPSKSVPSNSTHHPRYCSTSELLEPHDEHGDDVNGAAITATAGTAALAVSSETTTDVARPPCLSDIFSGPSAAIAARVVELGVDVERTTSFDILTGGAEHDLTRPNAQRRAYVRANLPGLTIAAPPCTVWAGFSAANYSKDALARLRQDSASSLIGPLVKHLRFLHASDRFFLLEQPRKSTMLELPCVQKLIGLPDVRTIYIDQCRFNDGMYKKPTTFITNLPKDMTRNLEKTCNCSSNHATVVQGPSAAATAAYPPKLVTAIAKIAVAIDIAVISPKIMTQVHSTTRRKMTTTIIDTGAEHTMVNANDWRPTSSSNDVVNMTAWGGAQVKVPIGSAALRVVDDEGSPFILVLHQVGLSTTSVSLIDPYQIRQANNTCEHDLCPGKPLPYIKVGKRSVPLALGTNVSLVGHRPTDHEMKSLPHVSGTLDSTWSRPAFMADLRASLVGGNTMSNVNRLSKSATLTAVPTDLFPWLSDKMRAMTAKHTTRLSYMDLSEDLNNHQLRSPALQHRRIADRAYMDTMFATTPSFEGFTMAQVFSLKRSRFVYIRGLREKAHVTPAVQDFARDVGIPDELFSDNAMENKTIALANWCRGHVIRQLYTEPKHSHANASERQIGSMKRISYRIMETAGAPPSSWYAAMKYASLAHNKTSLLSLNGTTPHEAIGRGRADISEFVFPFYSQVQYTPHSVRYPDQRLTNARYLYPDPNSGGTFAHRLLLPDGSQLTTSRVRPITPPSPATPGESVTTKGSSGEDVVRGILMYQHEPSSKDTPEQRYLNSRHRELSDGKQKELDAADAAALNNDEDDRTTVDPSATVIDVHLDDDDSPSTDDPSMTTRTPDDNDVAEPEGPGDSGANTGSNFGDRHWHLVNGTLRSGVSTGRESLGVRGERQREVSIAGYGTTSIPAVNHEADEDSEYRFTGIKGYRNTSKQLELKISWEDGTTTWEPFKSVAADDPVTTAAFINRHARRKAPSAAMKDALKWASGETIAQAAALHVRLQNPDGRGSGTTAFGIYQPRGIKDALRVDREFDADAQLSRIHGDQRWVAGALKKELSKFDKYKALRWLPKGAPEPQSSQRMRCHSVFTAKPDGTFKARFVAGGNTVDTTGVHRSMSAMEMNNTRILYLIAKANEMTVTTHDLENGYLQAKTAEAVHFIAGPEFGAREGLIAVCVAAIYGLVGSAFSFHRHVHAKMTQIGFKQSEGDPNIWLKWDDEFHVYTLAGFYVDDVCLVSKRPEQTLKLLKSVFQLKDTGETTKYLGADVKDVDGTIHFSASSYIRESLEQLKDDRSIGKSCGITTTKIPYREEEQPELDQTELLDYTHKTFYQRAVGMAQWIVHGLGRFDIAYATSQFSRFTNKPRVGHLDGIMRVFGYLQTYPDKTLAIDPSTPRFVHKFDKTTRREMQSEYPEAVEELSINAPTPCFQPFPTTCFVDASHGGDQGSRRSISGILLFVGSTVVLGKSKMQPAVQSSTFTAEFMAMRTATELIMGLRFLLRSLGVPVTEPTRMYGDNEASINNATHFTACLKRKHNAISYLRVRECVAAGVIDLTHINTDWNYADMLTKGLCASKLTTFRDQIMY